MSIQEDAPPTLAYVVPAEDVQAAPRARRLLAVFTLAYVATALAPLVSFNLIQRGLLPSSFNFAGGSGLYSALQVMQAAALAAMAVAASLMIVGGSRGILVLRAAAGVAAVVMVLMETYWRVGIPGGINLSKSGDLLFVSTGIAASALNVPALICAMTFPLRKSGAQ